jgi:flagellar biosynthesis/type III secretory pathway chaperone
MSAAQRLALLDDLPPAELCRRTEGVLHDLVRIMNAETTFLRAGHYKQAAEITAEKTQLAQDYVGLARAIQRRLAQLKAEAPDDVQRLAQGHESLATQMADNLRVIATARSVTETLLSDVASVVGAQNRTKTYGATGVMNAQPAAAARGISVNRAL